MIRLVLWHSNRGGAVLKCATIRGLDIRNINVDRASGSFKARRVTRFKNNHGITDLRLDMEGLRPKLVSLKFHGAERILDQIPQREMPMDIRSDGAKAVPHMIQIFGHGYPLSPPNGWCVSCKRVLDGNMVLALNQAARIVTSRYVTEPDVVR